MLSADQTYLAFRRRVPVGSIRVAIHDPGGGPYLRLGWAYQHEGRPYSFQREVTAADVRAASDPQAAAEWVADLFARQIRQQFAALAGEPLPETVPA